MDKTKTRGMTLLNFMPCIARVLRSGKGGCSARDWDGKDYLRIIPRVVW
jgi:hypothetical protein